jgi:hypothetical protein
MHVQGYKDTAALCKNSSAWDLLGKALVSNCFDYSGARQLQ